MYGLCEKHEIHDQNGMSGWNGNEYMKSNYVTHEKNGSDENHELL